MTVGAAPTDVLHEAAVAAGLIDTGLTGWRFAELAKVLAIPERRQALALALAELAPEVEPGWHLIVREDPVEVHLVADLPETGGAGSIGVGVRVARDFDDGPSGSASLVVPLVASTGGADARVVVGQATHPLTLRVEADIAEDGPFASIGLVATLSEAPDLLVVVRGGAGRDADDERTLGLEDLPGLAIEIVAWAAGASPGLAAMIATVVGQGPGTPVLDLGELLSRPEQAGETLRGWIASLDDTALRGWLGALGGLVEGAAAPVVPTGSGAADQPWSVPFVPGEAPLRLTLARRGAGQAATLEVGLAAEASAPPVAGVTAEGRVGVALLSVPLAPGLPLRLGLTGGALVRVGRTDGTPLVDAPAARCGAVLAGVRWSDRLMPVLELRGVKIGAAPEEAVLDLTSPDAVAAAAGGAIDALLTDVIGGAGRILGVLCGLTAPATDPGRPPVTPVPVTALISDPAGSIRAHHRGLLADGRWWLVLREIARALGRDEPVTGEGTAGAPWRVTLVEARDPALVHLELVAWDEGGSDGVRRLRLGLGARSAAPPVEAALRLAIAGIDLPPPGAAVALRLLGDAELSIGVATGEGRRLALPDGALLRGAASVGLRWTPGSLPNAAARLDRLLLTTASGAEIPIPDLALPSPEGAPAVAAEVVGALAAAALPIWLGDEGTVLSGLLGLGGAAWGGAAGSPASAVLGHARTLLAARDEEGLPAIAGALAGIEDLTAGLAGRAAAGTGSRSPGGAGTRDDPWLLGDGPAQAVVGEVWLEPDGSARRRTPVPPSGEAPDGGPPPQLSEALAGMVAALGPRVDGIGEIAPARDGPALEALAAALAGGDGRLSADDTLPEDETWIVEPPVTAFHDDAPADGAVADVVAAAVDELRQGATAPPVVVVGPWGLAAIPGAVAIDAAGLAAGLDRTLAVPSVLVAHGADVPALLAAARAHPAMVEGMVLVCPPLAAGPLPGDDLPDALRLAARLLATAGREGPARACLDARVAELDGWHTPPGGLPVPVPTPARAAAAAGDAAFDRAPVIVVPARLPPLGDELRAAIAAITATAPPVPDPARARVGATARLPVPAAEEEGSVRVDARLRVLGLGPQEGPADAGLAIEARVERLGGWLVGGPGAGHEARVRVLTARAEVAWTGGGEPVVSAMVELIDAGLRAPSAPVLVATHAAFDPLLADVARALAADAVAAPSGAAAWALRALRRLGIAADLPDGETGVVRDALDALRTGTAAALLGPRVRAALLDGHGADLGLAGPAQGPWTVGDGAGAVTLEGRVPGWVVSAETRAPLALGAAVSLDVGATLLLGVAPPAPRTAHAELALGPCAMRIEEGRAPVLHLPGDDPISLDRGFDDAGLAALGQRLAVSAIASLLAPTAFGPAVRLLPIDGLVRDPAGWLSEAGRLAAAGGGPDPVRVGELLRLLAGILGATPTGGTVPLGATARLRTPVAAADPLAIELDSMEVSEGVRVGGALGLSLGPRPMPSGALEVALTLPAGAPWTQMALRAALGPAGPRLALAPTGAGGAEPEIELFPTFAGLAVLSTGVARGLPAALDALTDALATPLGPVPDAVLALADALGLRADQAGTMRFAGAPERFEALAAGDLMGALAVSPDPATLAQRAAAVLTALGVPLGAANDGPDVALSLDGVPVRLLIGAGEPAFGVGLGPLTAGVARLDTLRVRVGLPPGAAPSVSAGLTASVDAGLGGARVSVSAGTAVTGGGALLQLVADDPAAGQGPGLRLLPAPALLRPEALPEFVALPLLGMILAGQEDLLVAELWDSGPSVRDILLGAGIVTEQGGALSARSPSPPLLEVAAGTINTLAGELPMPEGLEVGIAVENGELLLRIGGVIPFGGSDGGVLVEVGAARAWAADAADRGISLRLLTGLDGGTVALDPSLVRLGAGVRVSREAAPLLDVGVATIGAAGIALLYRGGAGLGGGILVEDIAVPLEKGAAEGGGGNPVAGSMLQSKEGESAPVRPGLPRLGLVVPPGGGPLRLIPDPREGIRIPVHTTFGPIRIDEIFIAAEDRAGTIRAILALDAGVAIGPLAVSVDDLTIKVPVLDPVQFSQWGFDLRGLAASFEAGIVSLSGGLLRAELPPQPGAPTNDPTIEYRGSLHIQVAQYGITALGAYAQPTDALGKYTSLFVFVALSATLGGPPYFVITGLAGGFGYNRRLIPPPIEKVPSFPLVSAIDGPSGDPMESLQVMGTNIPPERGALWFAAGLRFSTFAVVQTTAVLYVAINGTGLDIGLLGVTRAALPPGSDVAIAQIELALGARFSTSEGILSVQAQLTENSWLLMPECRLTGGFAFVIWFRKAQFILTLGGYHDHFKPKDLDLPKVPRLGFQWQVQDQIVIKGWNYFALSSSCLMAGLGMEATYDDGTLYASFICRAEVIAGWDPPLYEVAVEIAMRVRAFGLEAGLGVLLELNGPPTRGRAVVEVGPFRPELKFGSWDAPPQYLNPVEFLLAHVLNATGDAVKGALAAVAGVVPPHGDPDPAVVLVGPDFVVETETGLPSTGWAVRFAGVQIAGVAAAGPRLDWVPCGAQGAGATTVHRLDVTPAAPGGPTAAEVRDQGRLEVSGVRGRVPDALWQAPPAPAVPMPWGTSPEPAARLVEAVTGVRIAGRSQPSPPAATVRIALEAIDPTGPDVVIGRPAGAAPGPRVVDAPSRTADADDITTGPVVVGRLAGRIRVAAPGEALSATTVAGLAAADDVPRRVVASPGAPPPEGLRILAVADATSLPAPASAFAGGDRSEDAALGRLGRAGRGEGVLLEPGELDAWALPGEGTRTLALSGRGRARVTVIGRGGVVREDRELTVAGPVALRLDPEAEMCLVAALGDRPDAGLTGWQDGTTLVATGPSALIGPGCVIARGAAGAVGPHVPAAVRASIAMAGQHAVETVLGAGARTVVVIAEPDDGEDVADGVEVRIDAPTGAQVAVDAGGRAVRVVGLAEPAGERLVVGVRIPKGARLAGVLGVPGSAEEWAARLSSGPPPAAAGWLAGTGGGIRVRLSGDATSGAEL